MLASPRTLAVVPDWRPLRSLTSTEARFLAEHDLYVHPETVHVTCMPGMTNFSVVEEKAPGIWRWTVCCSKGMVRDEGWELTLTEARCVAVEAQRLWFHRCDAKGLCHCAAREADQSACTPLLVDRND